MAIFSHRFIAAQVLGLCNLLGIFGAAMAADGPTGKVTSPLGIDTSVKLWTAPNNNIPVCWASVGFQREKQLVRQAVTDSWEYYGNLRFTGWGACPSEGGGAQVRMRVTAQGAVNSGAGGSAALGMNTLTVPGAPPAVNFSFNPDGSADAQRVEYVGVHEFGHVLGFVHEQDLPGNPEGPAGCNQTQGVDINGKAVTPYDPDSVMNYCNRNGNRNGLITDADIEGVRRIYGARTHWAPGAAVMLNNGEVWRYTGRPCTAAACPGWAQIDHNPRTVQIVSQADAQGLGSLYQRHANGEVWQWDGRAICDGAACPGWRVINKDARIADLAATASGLFARLANGELWRWDGRTVCVGTACPGWTLIDRNSRTRAMAASGESLFQRHENGDVWRWDGRTACTAAGCGGWAVIDRNVRTREIAAAEGTLFQRHEDGRLWRWDGRSLCTPAGVCPGWALIDMNPRTHSLAAAGATLFQRHADAKVWRWDGRSICTATACPGWRLIDQNANTVALSGSAYGGAQGAAGLVQLQTNGLLWQWDGQAACQGARCPGWTLINRDPRIRTALALGRMEAPSRLSMAALR